jgi:2-polyprenyl-3-methyl-5-hydroxy-6-metoxy-1,4-benzoquinol methylase
VPLKHTFVDLGVSPLANSYLKEDQLQQMEPFYPLHAFVCNSCFLVQVPEFQSPKQIFSEYAYFSSYSESWLKHAKTYVELMVKKFAINSKSQVIEIGSNDGYLLQYFKEKNIPALGVEPAQNLAKVANEAGIPTLVKFFNEQTAMELAADRKHADLINGINVLAQIPNLHDAVKGIKILLKPQGVVTIEFPHLMRLIEENQFDTIYHEHFSYFSLYTVREIFAQHGLTLFDLEELPTFGGSLRIYLCHTEDSTQSTSTRVSELLSKEIDAGLTDLEIYHRFGEKVKESKRKILDFMLNAKRENKSIAAYGAPAKGNTLLNYCGIRNDFIDYAVDKNPHKQKHFLPGTRIPIYNPDKIRETKPDYLLILPWNIKEEIMEQMSHIREWKGKFAVLIPEVQVYS